MIVGIILVLIGVLLICVSIRYHCEVGWRMPKALIWLIELLIGGTIFDLGILSGIYILLDLNFWEILLFD